MKNDAAAPKTRKPESWVKKTGLKFTLIFMSAGLIQIGSFALLKLIPGFPYWARYLIALVLSVICNFTVNRKIIFRCAANIPLAIAKVFGYYCVFTPFSTILGDYLADAAGWNDFIVLLLSMVVNFVTVFLFIRFLVCGKQADNSQANAEKHRGGEAAVKSGPAVSRTSVIVCTLCVVLAAAAIILVRTFGYSAPDLLTGSWVTYSKGERVVYGFDGGVSTVADADGHVHENAYTVDGDRVTLTGGSKPQVYLWTHDAVTLFRDHAYADAVQLVADRRSEIADLRGYMYVEGDYLYMGPLCMCREDKLADSGNTSLAGSWTGAAGDTIRFDADGTYHYREYGQDYDGQYTIDGDTLTLILDNEPTVLKHDEWGIEGRVLHILKQYYFLDAEEE